MAQYRENETEKATIATTKNILEDWLRKNFRNEATKNGYRQSCLRFLKAIYGEDYKEIGQANEGIDRYFGEAREFIDDFKLLIQWMNNNNFCPMTINSTCGCLRKFFSRHGHKITDEDWKDMKLALIPANVVSTQDEILSKEEFRNVLKYLSIHAKAIALFLLSTGCRIGESLKLDIQNVDLDADPPEARITPATSKKGVGGRTVFMSYEARDSVRDWLKIKGTKKKAGGQGEYSKDLVFGGIAAQAFGKAWRKALERANLGKRDSVSTNSIYHVHTLRKFFSTAMSEAKVQESIVHAWEGHKAYLDDAYKRYTKDALRQMYKDHMDAVTIFEYSAAHDVQALKEEMQKSIENAKNAMQENIKLKENERYLRQTFQEFGVTNNRPIQEMMVDLVHKLIANVQKEIPQPTKSEPATPIQVVQNPSIVNDHEQTAQSKEVATPEPKLQTPEWVACPTGIWVKKQDCEQQCKTSTFKQYSFCQSERARNPNGILFRLDVPKPQ
jgi:integrase